MLSKEVILCPKLEYLLKNAQLKKKDKIVAKGFELMCENGYFNTSTNDIAKYAGVSTGIIYQYFNDKKEIFIEGLKIILIL